MSIGAWLETVAHQRMHGTTGTNPQVLLEKERFALQPLLSPTRPIAPLTMGQEWPKLVEVANNLELSLADYLELLLKAELNTQEQR